MTHFLNLSDFSSSEAESLLQEALSLKNNKDNNNPLKGKYLALIFEKASTRTRVSFEVGMTQLGGKAGFLSTSDLQLGRGEPIEDTARVISSMADAVVLRTISHETLNLFADHSSVPVINGLTNLSHPCQLLADLLTFYECKGEIRDAKVTWVGDYNNVCFSYVEASKLFQFNLEIACPKTYWPSTEVMQETSATFTEDLKAAVKESDLITTDVWVSMGDEAEAIFLHCLPAIRGQEVSENMLEDPRSKVWVQAENRLHAQKALLLKLLNH